MPARCSKRGGLIGCFAVSMCWVVVVGPEANAQSGQVVTDPETGIRYQRRYRTEEQPVVEQRTEPRVVTTMRPETVTEMESVQQTYFAPVVRYDWEPRWHNVWNPFVPATLGYHYRPRMQWEPRVQTYQRPKTTTRWVAEKRVVQESRLVTAMQQRQVEEWVAIGPGRSGAGVAPQVLPGDGTRMVQHRAAATGLTPASSARVASRNPSVPPARPSGDRMQPTVLGADPYRTTPAYGGTIYR